MMRGDLYQRRPQHQFYLHTPNTFHYLCSVQIHGILGNFPCWDRLQIGVLPIDIGSTVSLPDLCGKHEPYTTQPVFLGVVFFSVQRLSFGIDESGKLTGLVSFSVILHLMICDVGLSPSFIRVSFISWDVLNIDFDSHFLLAL